MSGIVWRVTIADRIWEWLRVSGLHYVGATVILLTERDLDPVIEFVQPFLG